MAELLVNALNDLPAEPALFLPEPHGGKDPDIFRFRSSPSTFQIRQSRLTVQPMDSDRRDALLRHIVGLQ